MSLTKCVVSLDFLDVIQLQSPVNVNLCNRSSREQHVSNLAPIQLFERGAAVFFGLFVVIQPAQQLLPVGGILIGKLLDKIPIDSLFLFVIKVFVSYGKVYTRLQRSYRLRGLDFVKGELDGNSTEDSSIPVICPTLKYPFLAVSSLLITCHTKLHNKGLPTVHEGFTNNQLARWEKRPEVSEGDCICLCLHVSGGVKIQFQSRSPADLIQ